MPWTSPSVSFGQTGRLPRCLAIRPSSVRASRPPASVLPRMTGQPGGEKRSRQFSSAMTAARRVEFDGGVELGLAVARIERDPDVARRVDRQQCDQVLDGVVAGDADARPRRRKHRLERRGQRVDADDQLGMGQGARAVLDGDAVRIAPSAAIKMADGKHGNAPRRTRRRSIRNRSAAFKSFGLSVHSVGISSQRIDRARCEAKESRPSRRTDVPAARGQC